MTEKMGKKKIKTKKAKTNDKNQEYPPEQNTPSEVRETHSSSSNDSCPTLNLAESLSQPRVESELAPAPSFLAERCTVDGGNSNATKSRKRGRGTTKNLKLAQKERGEKWFVQFNEYGKPIGKNARVFNNYLGMLVKIADNAPLNVKQFSMIDDTRRQRMWDNIVEHFEFNEDDLIKKRIWQSLNKKYKDYRCRLHTDIFLKFNTKEERIAHRPKNIVDSDWKWLVDYFDSDEFKNLSKVNKDNRHQQKTHHTSGSKSFAEIEDDETRNGGSCSQLKLYKLTHMRKNGSFVDQASQEAISKVDEMLAQNEGLSNPMTEEEIYISCVAPKERHGRVRGKGSFVTPSQVFGSSSTQQKIMKENADLKVQLQEVREDFSIQLESRDKEIAEMKVQLQMLMKAVSAQNDHAEKKNVDNLCEDGEESEDHDTDANNDQEVGTDSDDEDTDEDGDDTNEYDDEEPFF